MKARLSSLLKRFANADEVAAMAIHFASELLSAANGAALQVDGGVVRAILYLTQWLAVSPP